MNKNGNKLIELKHISKTYYIGGEEVRANNDVSVSIDQGEFVAIVGNSRSRKSTLIILSGHWMCPQAHWIQKPAGMF